MVELQCDKLSCGIVILSRKKNPEIVGMNDKMRDFLRISDDDEAKMLCENVYLFIDPKDRKRVSKAIDAARLKGKEKTGEVSLLLADGKKGKVLVRIAEYDDEYLQCICMDIPNNLIKRYAKKAGFDETSPAGDRDSLYPYVKIRTFGYFDVFVDGKPILFKNVKTKELFALMVDRQGGYVSSDEAIAILWEDEPASALVLARYRKVALRLKNLLEEYGIAHIVEYTNGRRRIVPDFVDCDLYTYLSDKTAHHELFNGSYLSNYSWGERTLGELMQ